MAKRGRKKGTPKTGGRKKGVQNRVTVEAKVVASALVENPAYLRKLAADFKQRKVHPTIESMIWYYAKGKPKETLDVKADVEVSQKAAETRDLPEEDLNAALDLANQSVARVETALAKVRGAKKGKA